ncbi:ribosomal protein S18 acetylase RimI-like enzyme [Amycolatopsis sulphurea]|uniref:Ribosomal protein S18 acetylase RimI-like enzyme n=1 Tax=Amycolatopsis sulphurea TaxID=76022 RepID=A0A2A9FEQ6_9PSEU|nr:N-acetyltransferase [Amycolatopsis sulphurea]PFG49854.1 ribosomal protein S18 acetylase RimI-like enzyme [Amycolatopsis sulphurea]
MHLRLRPATEADLDALIAILNTTIPWLRERGLDQWYGIPWHAAELAPGVAAGIVYLATDDDGPAATMTLDPEPDPEFWTVADDPHSALYLTHFAVDRGRGGQGIGTWMIDQALHRAAARGKRSVRLDAWKTNPGLQDYYRGQGFRHVRTMEVPGRGSGALFERPVPRVPASSTVDSSRPV